MRLWFDIDNPPQVRYLVPLAHAAAELGHGVVVTARDYGMTYSILRDEGVAFAPVGRSFGKGKVRKVSGVVRRSRELSSLLRRERPDVLITGSRSGALAARRLGIPSFVIVDYEYTDARVYRLAGTRFLHSHLIPPEVLEEQGILRGRLIPFRNMKEELSFDGMDVDAVVPHRFGSAGTVRVLVRPAAEESHYYRPESRELTLALLRWFAARPDAEVVYSLRAESQARDIEAVGPWQRPPVVLRHPLPFVALLKGVDAVVSAGGTMLREAAYLGVPAYSVFQGSIGAVDRHLASIGRLTLLRDQADFQRIVIQRRPPLAPLRSEPGAARELIAIVVRSLTEDGAVAGGRAGPRERERAEHDRDFLAPPRS
jgi:predicted glycosyltransferase